jgi:regulator of protease activity HflC (stomatin/prohibitin superfamily)
MVDPILLTFGAIALIIVLLYLLSGIRVLKEWERAPVLRLGRYVGMKGRSDPSESFHTTPDLCLSF